MRRLFTIACVVFVLLSWASAASAADQPTSLGELVTTAYSYSLSVVGICVFVMLLYAGVRLILGDRASAIKVAQDAVIGLVLLYSAYVILNSISPQFVKGP